MAEERLVKDPIYRQLNQLLRNRILKSEYAVGDKFMTEREICAAFGVSRATANKALSNLVSEGLLMFKKGVGTFVAGLPNRGDTASLAGFTNNVTAAGMVPTTRVVAFRRIAATAADDPDAASRLHVGANESLFMMDRLRFADGVPMVLEHRYVVAKYCPDLDAVKASGSLYRLFESDYAVNVTGSEEVIRAVTIGPREAELLGIEPGRAGFLIEAVGYVNETEPLWWEQTLYRPDGFEFRCRVQASRTSPGVQQRFLVEGTPRIPPKKP